MANVRHLDVVNGTLNNRSGKMVTYINHNNTSVQNRQESIVLQEAKRLGKIRVFQAQSRYCLSRRFVTEFIPKYN